MSKARTLSPSAVDEVPAPSLPRIWLLTGEKAGDRAQIVTLAEALGWPFEEKRLHFNRLYKRSNIWLGASLSSLDAQRSDALHPPWPDLVLASGRRAVPVARWIKRQSLGQTRLVHIGRPWAPLWHFDLVVSTAQYQLPRRQNVLANDLTLNYPAYGRLQDAADRWRPVFADCRRPLIGLLVGGSIKPFVFDAETAASLGRAVRDLAQSSGGTVVAATSRRTPDSAVDALSAELPREAYLHRFGADAENPYLGILALADRLVVTSDSASMLSEACLSGKPVHVYMLPEAYDRKMQLIRIMRRLCLGAKGDRRGLAARLYHAVLGLGIAGRASRDMQLFHARLMARGLVRPWDNLSTVTMIKPRTELERTVDRVRNLYSNGQPQIFSMVARMETAR